MKLSLELGFSIQVLKLKSKFEVIIVKVEVDVRSVKLKFEIKRLHFNLRYLIMIAAAKDSWDCLSISLSWDYLNVDLTIAPFFSSITWIVIDKRM